MADCIIQRAGGAGVDCDDATATVADVLDGITFGGSASDELQTGEMPYRGTKNYSITTNGGSITVDKGYHSGSGKVTYTLPSVAGGTTYTPTASAQTVSLANKYLKSNISVAGSANLIASNILSGKTIWGKSGSFVPLTNISTVYNGSTFAGFLASGFYNNPSANGSYIDSPYAHNWSEKSRNSAITGGSLYITSDTAISSSYSSRLVSVKSIDFSVIDTIRIVGSLTVSATVYNHGTVTNFAYVTVSERTNGSTSVSESIRKTTDTISSTSSSDDITVVGGTVAVDLTYDVSDWSATNGFLDINVTGRGSLSGSGTWRGGRFTITAIYLS